MGEDGARGPGASPVSYRHNFLVFKSGKDKTAKLVQFCHQIGWEGKTNMTEFLFLKVYYLENMYEAI